MRLLSLALASLVASTALAATKEYPLCSSQQTQQYYSALSNEISQCKTTSTYDLTSTSFPSVDQREGVCKCTPLIKQIANIRVPRCKISLDGNPYKFKDAIQSIFADCSGVSVVEEPLPASQVGSGSGETGGDADTPSTTTAAPKATTAAPKATTAAPNVTTAAPTTTPAPTNVTGSAAGSAGSTDIEVPPTPSLTPTPTKTPAASTTVPTPAPTSASSALATVSVAVAAVSVAVALL